MQPYADSPLDEEPMAETVYLNILAQAQRYVYIYTPYLAVGEEMLDALKNAAKRGVDIRLVLPGIPDKKLVFRLSRSYYLPLLSRCTHLRIYARLSACQVLGKRRCNCRSGQHQHGLPQPVPTL